MNEIITEAVRWAIQTFGTDGGAIVFSGFVIASVVACGFLGLFVIYVIEKYIQW